MGVVAAFLGRIFLKEELRCTHVAAILCSLSGALLITKPGFLVGSPAISGNQVLGYAFALLTGLFKAACCITARSSTDTSVLFVTFSTSCIIGGTTMALPYLSPLDDFSLEKLIDYPFWAACLLLGISSILLLTSLMYSTATQLCPAAISSMVNSAASMVVGYIAQMAVFGSPPGVLTLIGTAFMFIGVAVMAVSRKPDVTSSVASSARDTMLVPAAVSVNALSTGTCSEAETAVVEDSIETGSAVDRLEDDTESLMTFVASEYVKCAPEMPRQRRPKLGDAIGGTLTNALLVA